MPDLPEDPEGLDPADGAPAAEGMPTIDCVEIEERCYAAAAVSYLTAQLDPAGETELAHVRELVDVLLRRRRLDEIIHRTYEVPLAAAARADARLPVLDSLGRCRDSIERDWERHMGALVDSVRSRKSASESDRCTEGARPRLRLIQGGAVGARSGRSRAGLSCLD